MAGRTARLAVKDCERKPDVLTGPGIFPPDWQWMPDGSVSLPRRAAGARNLLAIRRRRPPEELPRRDTAGASQPRRESRLVHIADAADEGIVRLDERALPR